jgi:hypothetical protein
MVLDWKGAWVASQEKDFLARNRPDLRPVLEALASVRSELAQLAFSEMDPAQNVHWRKKLDTLQKRSEDLLAELGRKRATDRAGQPSSQTGPNEVAAALPEGTALIDFVVHFDFQGKLMLLAFVARRYLRVEYVVLGEQKPVYDAVVAWRQAVQTHEQEALDRSAAALERLVWKPLAPHLGNIRTVLVAPDWPLSIFPFAALPGRVPGSYLIEDVAIGYMSSGWEAAALLTAPGGTDSGGLLTVGDVDFQADPGPAVHKLTSKRSLDVVAADRDAFRPLPGTRVEGEIAHELFQRNFPDQPAILLTGAEPTEGEVK